MKLLPITAALILVTQPLICEAPDSIAQLGGTSIKQEIELVESDNSVSQKTVQLASVEPEDLGTFTITAYTAGAESTGKAPGHPEYGITASGEPVEEGVTIAADWDVLPPGTRVYIEGVGERVVQDRGGRIEGKRLDLYVPEVEDALAWGIREREVQVIEWGE